MFQYQQLMTQDVSLDLQQQKKPVCKIGFTTNGYKWGIQRDVYKGNSCIEKGVIQEGLLSFSAPNSQGMTVAPFVIAFHTLFHVLLKNLNEISQRRGSIHSPAAKQPKWPHIHSHITHQKTKKPKMKKKIETQEIKTSKPLNSQHCIKCSPPSLHQNAKREIVSAHTHARI